MLYYEEVFLLTFHNLFSVLTFSRVASQNLSLYIELLASFLVLLVDLVCA